MNPIPKGFVDVLQALPTTVSDGQGGMEPAIMLRFRVNSEETADTETLFLTVEKALELIGAVQTALYMAYT